MAELLCWIVLKVNHKKTSTTFPIINFIHPVKCFTIIPKVPWLPPPTRLRPLHMQGLKQESDGETHGIHRCSSPGGKTFLELYE